VGRIVKMALLSLLLFRGVASSGYYEIVDVVEVGPISGSPFSCPMRWSPDGDRVAYFHAGYLMVGDTLGNARQMVKMEQVPRRFEWVSPQEIMVLLERDSTRMTISQMVLFDLGTGEQQVMIECRFYWGRPPSGIRDETLMGPYVTAEGNVYYRSSKSGADKVYMVPGKYRDSTRLRNNHILEGRPSGKYIVNLETGDSISVFSRPYADTVQSPAKAYLSQDGFITRLSDSSVTNLNPYIGPPPPGTDRCAVVFDKINPRVPEVLFEITCDVGEFSWEERIGISDFSGKEFTILDTLIGISHCTEPIYDPAGKNITFYADGKVYIIRRRAL
jgi:hypothetical protein